MLDITHSAELRQLDVVEELATRYHRTYGVPPVNLSHWDTSADFQLALRAHVGLSFDRSVVDYVYPSRIGTVAQILRKLGVREGHDGLVTPSGTAGIVCAANWLRLRGVRHVTIVGPTYWTSLQALRLLQVDASIVPARRSMDGFHLPDLDGYGDSDAVWLTLPYYSTGVPLQPRDYRSLEIALDRGVHFVLDECLAIPGSEMLRYLDPRQNLLSIYEPHKALSINGLKFSTLVMHPAQRPQLRHWGTVLFGSLGVGVLAAIGHFLSPAFDECVRRFQDAMAHAFADIRRGVSDTGVEFDELATGNYVTMYLRNIASSLEHDVEFTWGLVRHSGAVFIPNSRNHLDPNAPYSFRLNLAANNAEFYAAVVRIAHAATEASALTSHGNV